MSEISKCLNEWNATIEALGQGKQSILIRKYNTSLKEFLLYPTTSYAKKDNFLDSFQEECKSFAKEFALPSQEDGEFEVKYYAKVDEIVEKSSNRIGVFNSFHIWTRDHVKSYLGRKPAHIWLLRVYKLDEPVMVGRSRGMLYANTNEPVSLENLEPVLSDMEFNKVKEELLSK
jgi:hypothetical protein